ncbi:cathepsin O isoform 4-T4 [Megaptera novaeangliae]
MWVGVLIHECGGCWAFTVVGAVESACAIEGQPLEALSVQQVLDCSYSNYGCNGGSPLNALNWLSKMQVKLVRESEYPFKAQNGLCRYFSDSHFGFSIKGYSAYDFRDHEDEMAKALLTLGPLIVVVDAVSWQDYLGGIIQHHCSSGEANHAVLVTGFDKTGSTPYWIVRNSWGTSWGIDGCVHVKMGGNICEALQPEHERPGQASAFSFTGALQIKGRCHSWKPCCPHSLSPAAERGACIWAEGRLLSQPWQGCCEDESRMLVQHHLG